MDATADFQSPWLLSSPHLQTLGAALPLYVRPPADARDETLRIPIEGGSLHAWAWWHPERRPTALLLHGVGGSVRSQYMVRAGKALFAAGYHVVRMDWRGAGESIADAPSLYHAGLTDDPRAVASYLRGRPEVEHVVGVGFSLGGGCMLNLAASAKGLLHATVAVSAPLDLATVSRLINKPLNLPYRAYILRSLLRQARDFARLHPQRTGFDPAKLKDVRTIWAYDDLVVAPMHGFGDAERYYAQVSAGRALPRVEVPTLMIHAEDDPLVPGHTVRPFHGERSGLVELALSKRGGHVGWFSHLGERAWLRTWAMERALAFLARTQ